MRLDGQVAFLDSIDAARLAVKALIDGGVRHVVLAPGSRSAPMAYALAEAEEAGRIEVQVRIDERVAGFTALGLALGSGEPAAVLTTSGTAVGNLLPAVMEANHAAVPLLVLSADRPEELRGTGANQTTIQLDIFGEHVRFAADIPAGANPETAIGTALSAARGRLPGMPAGPVQLNLAFRDPLTPALDGGSWDTRQTVCPPAREAGPFQQGGRPGPLGQEAGPGREAAETADTGTTHRTVVIAGHGAGSSAEVFARSLGLPLLADPTSNARYGPNSVGPYRLLLQHFGPASAQPIERAVVFGRPTLSRPIAALLARPDIKRALYLPRRVAWFVEGRRSEQTILDWDQLADFAGNGPDGWLEVWQDAARAADVALDGVLAAAEDLTGLHVAREVWARTKGNLVLGSSNPVRDADLAGRPQSVPAAEVYANRGLSGIDGTVSTATGIALATGGPTRVLLGDLTFLHDAGALLLGPGEREADLQLVVLNDGGGGIFSLLEHGILGRKPRYAAAVERLFGTPQAADIAALAAGYGLSHRRITTTADLAAALAEPPAGRSVLEIPASRSGLRELHASVNAAVTDAVGRLLGS
ncbi:MAG: 2-succinyl-5-enolpyruvyl-6-hydroxy-3-cyclohexene-1-carboxylic-acid synthase [Actinomycetota bacterium]|nr:2-succinyl-5-enolpyruvyl-6-hydroxy-3-cyclohexene-1-carboxylic-acid synthase [Actinomycetota bacterium]